MQSNALAVAVAFAALALSWEPAQARCADDLTTLQARVERAQKMRPAPDGAAEAAKVLKKFNESDNKDEVDCYNAVARARRALATAPPDAAAQPGQAQQPLGIQPQQPLGVQPQQPVGVQPLQVQK
jgi:hypothetical protein